FLLAVEIESAFRLALPRILQLRHDKPPEGGGGIVQNVLGWARTGRVGKHGRHRQQERGDDEHGTGGGDREDRSREYYPDRRAGEDAQCEGGERLQHVVVLIAVLLGESQESERK